MLGHGGMGRVYRAMGPNGEEVALKLLKADLTRDETVVRRFEREARAAQRIVHGHVVPVLDVGEWHGTPYLAQAFVRGGTLGDKIDREGPISVEDAVTMVVDVGGGLNAIHEVGLVHRDVKPANILLDEQGVCYITDFGLAKDSQASNLTRPGQAVGSLDYMAPEQIRAEDVGPTTDVYGLGCVMIAALTGQPPFADRPRRLGAGLRVHGGAAGPTAVRGPHGDGRAVGPPAGRAAESVFGAAGHSSGSGRRGVVRVGEGSGGSAAVDFGVRGSDRRV